ncbi:A1 family peptidase [Vibrio cholerae]|nr:A1 family peptidase [Vibrio cholerae]
MENRGLIIELRKGPFQNNGATPWYSVISIGTPPQDLCFCFDSGSNFNWVTSSLCGNSGCHHYSGHQFNIKTSSSFSWINRNAQNVEFGPWGTMNAASGSDIFTISGSISTSFRNEVFLSSYYYGVQFSELDWDGGIGLASHQYKQRRYVSNADQPFKLHNSELEFNFFLNLIEHGIVNPDKLYFSFQYEEDNGFINFGVIDESYEDSLEYVFLPWCLYQDDANYLWTTNNALLKVDGVEIRRDLFFALDSGSSQFKGDPEVLKKVKQLTTQGCPLVSILLFDEEEQPYAEFNIPSEVYRKKIECGEDSGRVIAQFEPLSGANDIVLVGSVLMEHLYSIFEYENKEGELFPKGIWVFNKKNGYKIIKNNQNKPAEVFKRKIVI